MKATIVFEGMKEFLEAEVKRQLTALVSSPSLEELSDALGNINETLADIETQLSDLRRDVEDMKAQSDKVSKMENQLNDLDYSVGNIESEVENIQSDYISSDDFDYENYIRTVDSLEEKVESVEDKMDELEKVGVEVDITKYEDEIVHMVTENFDFDEYKYDIVGEVKEYINEHMNIRMEWA